MSSGKFDVKNEQKRVLLEINVRSAWACACSYRAAHPRHAHTPGTHTPMRFAIERLFYPENRPNGRRAKLTDHSERRQPGAYRDLRPDPIFDIHPSTAIDLDIRDGDWCWIETHMGRLIHQEVSRAVAESRGFSATDEEVDSAGELPGDALR